MKVVVIRQGTSVGNPSSLFPCHGKRTVRREKGYKRYNCSPAGLWRISN